MGILDAALDPQFRSDVGRGLLDVANRGVAGLLGGPVDAAALALKPLGYSHPAPIGGSEWIGSLMEQAGMVSPERRSTAEFLASLLTPSVGTGGAKAVGLLSEMSPEVVGSAGRAGPLSMGYQLGAISPEGKARLLADLQAGKGSGTYRLGDVTEGQLKALQRLGLGPTRSRDVTMTDGVFGHLHDGRMLKDGFSPEDVTRFTEQAMSKSSQAELNTAKAHQNPALVNRKLTDALSGKRYDAQMPLKVEDGALTPATVFPRGLPGRNKKPPNE
ncbi:hypothetical protein [Alicycliphilus denitrificans]|uniref:Uncharacterized protein n=1 Tax=Alicycliphilus denitrificans TaxID=179636 RepID=A0A420KBP9_9BURK|nr:hypothetical protein [Alicycliphilus denitrificans]RKJ96628.1 hypothetical protein CE154_011435 [Alicycliphilus denitrificans]